MVATLVGADDVAANAPFVEWPADFDSDTVRLRQKERPHRVMTIKSHVQI